MVWQDELRKEGEEATAEQDKQISELKDEHEREARG